MVATKCTRDLGLGLALARRRRSQDLLGSVLGSNDNHGRRVARHHTRENGGIDNVEVVGTIDLGVEINHGAATLAAIIGADLGGTHPVVGATSTGSHGELDL